MNALVTAYCSCALCCGSPGKLTASGDKPTAGITVAGPRRYPLGTIVEIRLPEGWKRFTIQDRLAPRYDDRFDVFMGNDARRDHPRAILFGKKYLPFRIISTPKKANVR